MTDVSVDYNIDDLLYLMERLRHADHGCPWDLQQSFSSIVPHTIEETYEVVDAIERQDWPHVQEELGDLLFQVVFYCQLGQEQALFDWSGVVKGIVEKLLRRHPHVFPDGTLQSVAKQGEKTSEEEIKANWERIKAAEKSSRCKDGERQESRFGDIPLNFPALMYAWKLQKKAASFGFDWQEVTPVIGKVREELAELEHAIKENAEQQKLQEEMGDILFSCVNLCRFLNLDPETAGRHANLKFERRFTRMEQLIKRNGGQLENTDISEMEQCWQEAKLEGL
jgi:nucleoside triphosphate diphosphatase